MSTRDTPWPDGTPCWADLGVPDISKARNFYSDVFAWTVQHGGPETGGYSLAELNGRGVAGVGPKMGPAEAPTMWMTYLATSDADATAAKIKGAGGQLVVEPMDVTDVGRMAVAVDPAGAEAAAEGVERQVAVELDAPVLDEIERLTLLAKPIGFKPVDHRSGEAVVDLRDIHIARLQVRARP